MPEKTKPKEDAKRKKEKCAEKNTSESENAAWSEDQKEKSYYYDDAYGYEIYKPDEENDED